jgi:AraC family transcriptional regulator, arabinose operon regulatory protein
MTGHERRDDNWCWRPRGTPTALLVYTRTGRAVLRFSDRDDEQMISAGDVVLWAPGAPQHFGCHRGAEPWELIWVHFRPRDQWYDWLKWPSLGAGVARIPALPEGQRERVDAALLEMDGYSHSALPRATDLALNALERAVLWLDAANPGPRQLDDRVQEAVVFIARNLDRRLSVRTIADAVHLSPSRLHHLFKQHIGTSPARFVESRRMDRAKALLESSSLMIGAIARATGFSSQYYFATRFKAVAGVSPSDWRRQTRG